MLEKTSCPELNEFITEDLLQKGLQLQLFKQIHKQLFKDIHKQLLITKCQATKKRLAWL
jgi:hypothetical protein